MKNNIRDGGSTALLTACTLLTLHTLLLRHAILLPLLPLLTLYKKTLWSKKAIRHIYNMAVLLFSGLLSKMMGDG